MSGRLRCTGRAGYCILHYFEQSGRADIQRFITYRLAAHVLHIYFWSDSAVYIDIRRASRAAARAACVLSAHTCQ